MLNLPCTVIKEVLTEGLAAMAEDLSGIDKLFAGLSESDRAQIKHLIQKSKNYEVRLGYPDKPGKAPVFAIVLGPEQETDEPLGGVVEEDEDTEDIGTWMQGTVSVFCMSENANIAEWMHGLVKAVLLVNREVLEEAGFHTQRLGAADLQPEEGFQPLYPFNRIVSWTATYLDTYSTEYGLIAGAIVTGEAYYEEGGF